MNLKQLGWNDYFENSFTIYAEQGYIAGRVFAEHKLMYKVFTEYGEVSAEISGKLRYNAISREDFPAVGDWVAVSVRPEEKSATIHGVLPRRSKFSRKAAGPNMDEQILATNIDTVFLVNSLNHDFNLRRLERYLILAWESGANPVIILSKSDLCDDIEEKIQQVEQIAVGVPIHAISTIKDNGMSELKNYLTEGNTLALLGSSGVGKSTIINYLLGHEVQKVQDIREDDSRGRHTSTHREIFILPDGGLMIDTPGMREIQIWNGREGISETFEDIEAITRLCTFKDCKHQKEPGCAVKEALENGTLDSKRYESYIKLQKEIRHLDNKLALMKKTEEKRKQKSSSKHRKSNGYREVYE